MKYEEIAENMGYLINSWKALVNECNLDVSIDQEDPIPSLIEELYDTIFRQ